MGTNKGQCNDNFINHGLINGQILRDDQQNELSHMTHYHTFHFEHVAIWFWSISCYTYLYTDHADSRSKHNNQNLKKSNSLDIQQLVFPKILSLDNYWLQ